MVLLLLQLPASPWDVHPHHQCIHQMHAQMFLQKVAGFFGHFTFLQSSTISCFPSRPSTYCCSLVGQRCIFHCPCAMLKWDIFTWCFQEQAYPVNGSRTTSLVHSVILKPKPGEELSHSPVCLYFWSLSCSYLSAGTGSGCFVQVYFCLENGCTSPRAVPGDVVRPASLMVARGRI